MRKNIIRRIAILIRISQLHKVFLSIQCRLAYWIFDILKKYNTIVLKPKKSNRLAIFAIFQPKGLSELAKAELNYLIKLGYDIAISVPHALNQSDQTYIDQLCRFRIMRQNVGRDFGSYKDAIFGVGFDRISEYQRVLLINDSIYFPVGPTELFEKRFLSATADVIGLFENSEHFRHISSFFIDIKTEIFCGEKIKEFWRKYCPYNSRLYAIRKGECKLSKVLYKEANSIDILYSADYIVKNTISFLHSENFNFNPFFYLLSDVYFHTIKDHYFKTSRINIDLIHISFIDRLRRVIEFSSNAHSFGLNLMTLFGVPLLKRDIYYRESLDLAQIRMALEIVQEPLMKEIILEYRKRGSLSNQDPWPMLMIHLGVR